MSDDWNRFVRVIRSDGSERTMPLAAWNDELAERVLMAGGKFVLPEDPKDKPPPKIQNYLVSSQGQEDEETPEGVKELLLDIDEDKLNDKERGFLETVKDWHGPLTVRQLAWATSIVRKYRNRR